MSIETTLIGKKVTFWEAAVSKNGNIVSSPIVIGEDIYFIIKTESGNLKKVLLEALKVEEEV